MTAITRTINSKGVVIVKRIGKEKGNQKVVCRCPDCGKEFTTWISTFYRNINSCRCKYPASKRLYEIWVNMKTRCYNPNCYEAKYYSLKISRYVTNGNIATKISRNGLLKMDTLSILL